MCFETVFFNYLELVPNLVVFFLNMLIFNLVLANDKYGGYFMQIRFVLFPEFDGLSFNELIRGGDS